FAQAKYDISVSSGSPLPGLTGLLNKMYQEELEQLDDAGGYPSIWEGNGRQQRGSTGGTRREHVSGAGRTPDLHQLRLELLSKQKVHVSKMWSTRKSQ